MRTARVVTNLTCSQACTYCTQRRPTEDRAFVAPSAVEARIASAVASGAVELVLTGGEPTLRRDLPRLVARAREAGGGSPPRVILETHAGHVDAALAGALREAGLDVARVNLSGPDARLDAVTRDPGGFAASVAGLRALASAGIAVEVTVVLVRSTLGWVERVPAVAVEHAGAALKQLWFTVPVVAADPSEVVGWGDAAEAILRLDAAAKALGVTLGRAPESGPPPCVFPDPARVAHLFALNDGGAGQPGHQRVEACARCAVASRCPGFPAESLRAHPLPPLHPIADDRTRRRLSLISTVEDQIRRELVQPNRSTDGEGREVHEDLIRINFHCNQSCRFCFVSTHLPKAADAVVEAAIDEAIRQGHRVTLSGGEATLNPRLVDYIRRAKAGSPLPVALETNAVRLADPALAEAVVAAGLDDVFVSLHGSHAALSDAVTGAPGTFEKTVVGIDNLMRSGVRVALNFVIHARNAADLPTYVRFVAARWPGAYVNISFVAPSTDMVPRDEELIPRYADVLPFLAEALAEGERLGVRLGGFESMCGVPLCLVPASLQRYFRLPEVPAGFDRGEFVQPEACQACALRGVCYGLRRGYAALHGTGELRAVSAG